MSTREAVCKGACYRLGNGLAFNPWNIPWVPGIKDHIPQLKARVNRSAFCCMAQLWNDEDNSWNIELLNQLCEPESVEHIYKIP